MTRPENIQITRPDQNIPMTRLNENSPMTRLNKNIPMDRLNENSPLTQTTGFQKIKRARTRQPGPRTIIFRLAIKEIIVGIVIKEK